MSWLHSQQSNFVFTVPMEGTVYYISLSFFFIFTCILYFILLHYIYFHIILKECDLYAHE